MRQGTQTDAIHANLRNAAKRGQIHATRRFQLHTWIDGVSQADRLPQLFVTHIVEQNNIRIRLECVRQLIERIHLNFHNDPFRRSRLLA